MTWVYEVRVPNGESDQFIDLLQELSPEVLDDLVVLREGK